MLKKIVTCIETPTCEPPLVWTPPSAPGSLDLCVPPPSSVHATTDTVHLSLTASPASCAAVASPGPWTHIASDVYAGVGLSLDDCLFQRLSLSALVALPPSTHAPSRSLGTRSPSISAVRSPGILTSLSCEPAAARTFNSTATPRSDLPAVLAQTVGVHLTELSPRPRMIDDIRMPTEYSRENSKLSFAPARHAVSKQNFQYGYHAPSRVP